MSDAIQIATRKSPLALKQTELVHQRLSEVFPERMFEMLKLSTQVDERLNWSLEERGGIGLFTKELEEALLDGRAELAVHSAKDMPTICPEGLAVAGYLPRASVEDVLVHRSDSADFKNIAGNSPRRRAQLARIYPEVEWLTIRGNVETRLRKIAGGECEASLFAAAGLERLKIFSYPGLEFIRLSIDRMVPAPGQGAIAVQCRSEDLPKYENLFCSATGLAVSFEKAFLRCLGSGCQVPVGACFSDGLFRFFHPNTGHKTVAVSLEKSDLIETTLENILQNFPEIPAKLSDR